MPETDAVLARLSASAPPPPPPPSRSSCSQPPPPPLPPAAASQHACMREPSTLPLPSTPVPDHLDPSHPSSLSFPDAPLPCPGDPPPPRTLDDSDEFDEFDAEFGNSFLDQLCDEDLLRARAAFPTAPDGAAGFLASGTHSQSASKDASPDAVTTSASHPRASSSSPPGHDDGPLDDPTPPPFMQALPLGTFVTAKGTSLPALSEQALGVAKAKMEAWERDDDRAAKAASMGAAASHSSSQAKGTGTLTAPIRPSAPIVRIPSAAHTTPIGASQRSVSAPYHSHPALGSAVLSVTPARTVSASFASHKRPAQTVPTATPSPATRPRLSATSTPGPSTSGSARPSAQRSFGAPATSSRPMARRKAFRTPFKSASRPVVTGTPDLAPLTPAGNTTSPRFVHPGDVSVGTPSRGIGQPRGAIGPLAMPAALFDLDPHHAPRRTSLLKSIRPESVSCTEAAERGCPREVFTVLNAPWMGESFEFLGSGRVTYGPEDALGKLKRLGAAHLSLKWVRHHWGMILWKLAALARHQPERAERWWSWDQVLRQLRYRYEREVNAAQRSAINRIKQHDSPASQPMVLCVYKLELDNDPALEEEASGEGEQTLQPTLVLSDGWYTIRALLDDTLHDALQRGRIRVGNKLCIMGAKCEGGPVEPLEGFNSVTLHLHANGTQLAPWETKLGFRRTPWVSSLRSLCPLGGKVGLIRIRVTQVFDLGYLDSNAQERGSVHSASEEMERQALWDKERNEARVQLEQECGERLARSEEVVQAVLAVLGSPTPNLDEQVDPSLDDKLDQLFEASNPASALQRLCPAGQGLPALLHAARERHEAFLEEVQHEMAAELDERVPPRRVRAFRVIRCEDAIPPVPRHIPGGQAGLLVRQASKARSTLRTAQITVWDADQLSLRVGDCFLVSNVLPSAPASWRAPDEQAEVFLQTRQGARWIPISDPDPGAVL